MDALSDIVMGGVSAFSSRYDFAVTVEGVVTASERVLDFVAPVAFTFPANMTGSKAKARTAATASAVWSLRKNGTQFATITFAASGTTGAFSGSATSFAADDVLELLGPSTADGALADLAFTLAGTR